MKKLAIFVAAFVLTLGLAQCKKEQPATPQNTDANLVHLTVKVGDGSRADIADPSASGQYTFKTGDKLYVGYDNTCVGYLVYDNGAFTGGLELTEATEAQKLHFYYLGGRTATQDGETQQYTVDISDQTSDYPVISCGTSTKDYSASRNSYTTVLLNQCALVEFTTNEIPVGTVVSIGGMKNKVTVDFGNNTLAPSDETGSIMLHAASTTSRWAILLPQDGVTTTATAEDYYESCDFNVPAVAINNYLADNNGACFALYNTILDMPLTFEAKKANATVTLKKQGSAPTVSLEKSTDGVTWTTYTVGAAITLNNVGDKVMFRASTSNNAFGVLASRIIYYNYFQITDECFIYGNIMSLLDKTNYATSASFGSNNFVFCNLFDGCNKLYNHDVKSLLLPATTLTEYCYASMFNGCTSLTKAPELPATTMKRYCYSHMFDGCSSLTEAPDLPAQTLDKGSYQYMFSGCTSLEEAPELSATTLDQLCCRSMFEGCTSLITGPTLRATTLASGCYYDMFNGCTNLHSITCLTTTTISNRDYTADWVNGVSNSGTFTKASGIDWPSGNDGIPEGWTVISQ